MKRLLPFLLLALLALPVSGASEKPNTILLHPGEVIYARFSQKGSKLTLLKASAEKDDNAQIIFRLGSFDPANPKIQVIEMQVENRFADELNYKVELRAFKIKRRTSAPVYPVVGGKSAVEKFTSVVEEIAIFGCRLEK